MYSLLCQSRLCLLSHVLRMDDSCIAKLAKGEAMNDVDSINWWDVYQLASKYTKSMRILESSTNSCIDE